MKVCPVCGRLLYYDTGRGEVICVACTPPPRGSHLVLLRLIRPEDDQ